MDAVHSSRISMDLIGFHSILYDVLGYPRGVACKIPSLNVQVHSSAVVVPAKAESMMTSTPQVPGSSSHLILHLNSQSLLSEGHLSGRFSSRKSLLKALTYFLSPFWRPSFLNVTS